MFVFVFAVFAVLETCVYRDLWFPCLHIVFSVFVVARAFVALKISLFLFNRCLLVVFVVVFARFCQLEKVVFMILCLLTTKFNIIYHTNTQTSQTKSNMRLSRFWDFLFISCISR